MIWLKNFLFSLTFLTILPVGRLQFVNEKEKQSPLSGFMLFFPLIGFLIGAILVGFQYFFQFFLFNNPMIDVLLLAIWVLLSGGLHLEGLADTVDGFSGGKNKEEIIRIMKDGAVGAKGAIALIVILILKLSFLIYLPSEIKKSALLLTPMLGRWGMVAAGIWGKPASPQNTMFKHFEDHLGKKEFFLATLMTLLLGFFFVGFHFIFLIFIATMIVWWVKRYAEKKIGGISGDIMGMINELIELLILLVFYF